MKRTRILVVALLGASLAGCSNSSVKTSGSQVIAASTGSVLFYSLEEVMKKTHDAMTRHCNIVNGNVVEIAKEEESAEEDAWTGVQALHNFSSDIGTVKEIIEEGKAIIDIFPSHTYSVAVICPTSDG